jgi:hypothetical protein
MFALENEGIRQEEVFSQKLLMIMAHDKKKQ